MPIIAILTIIIITQSMYAFADDSETNSLLNPSLIPNNEVIPTNVNGENKYPPRLTTQQTLQKLTKTNADTIKIRLDGEILSSDAAHWDCIHIKSTGLTWEIKNNSGLRDKTNTYTWINNTHEENTLFSWFEELQGKCTGNTRCDSTHFIAKTNQQRLCNFSDWRMPTKTELESIINNTNKKNDNPLFPNMLHSWYWTGETNEKHPEFAWYVMFTNGTALSDKKYNPKHIRLVRGNL